MKSNLQLTNPIWNTETRRARLSVLVQASAAQLEGEIKNAILDSSPAGKTYRRGAISKAIGKSGKLPVKGLKTYLTAKGNRRVITGYNFHRASAPGQAPAVDTGALINSIRAQKIDDRRAKVSTAVVYAAALDAGTNIAGRNRKTIIKPRPFFAVTVKNFAARFRVKISEVLFGKK